MLCASTVRAAIATLNFDSGAQNGTAYSGTVPYNINMYSGYSSATLQDVTAASGANTVVAVGNGSSTALGFTTPGTGKKFSVAGSTFTLQLTASGNVTITTIQFDYNSKTAGDATWSYAIIGGGSGSATAIALGSAGTWNTATATFSPIALSSGQIITFTDTLTGQGTGHSESVSFDNIIVAVPEPINYALAGFGLIFVGGMAGRFYLGRKHISPAA